MRKGCFVGFILAAVFFLLVIQLYGIKVEKDCKIFHSTIMAKSTKVFRMKRKTIEQCMIYANVSEFEFAWPFEKRLSR